MPAALLSRDEVVERILAVFRQSGYDGASLAQLAAATGLGRSSLYHHFPKGKADMAAAAMQLVVNWWQEHVIAPLHAPGAPAERLRRFGKGLAEFYADGQRACLMDLFSIGEAGGLFQPALRKRLKGLIAELAAVAEEAGIDRPEASRRAEDAFIALQGALVVSRALGSTAPFARIIAELPDRLLRR
jgi:TetR/AcrR family transcriptional regulator, lmrAB and yxaGH operons repressor